MNGLRPIAAPTPCAAGRSRTSGRVRRVPALSPVDRHQIRAADAAGRPLKDAEIETIREWIDRGVEWPTAVRGADAHRGPGRVGADSAIRQGDQPAIDRVLRDAPQAVRRRDPTRNAPDVGSVAGDGIGERLLARCKPRCQDAAGATALMGCAGSRRRCCSTPAPTSTRAQRRAIRPRRGIASSERGRAETAGYGAVRRRGRRGAITAREAYASTTTRCSVAVDAPVRRRRRARDVRPHERRRAPRSSVPADRCRGALRRRCPVPCNAITIRRSPPFRRRSA